MINTDHKNYYNFMYKVNQNSPLYSKIKPADEILNVIKRRFEKIWKKNIVYTKWAALKN